MGTGRADASAGHCAAWACGRWAARALGAWALGCWVRGTARACAGGTRRAGHGAATPPTGRPGRACALARPDWGTVHLT